MFETPAPAPARSSAVRRCAAVLVVGLAAVTGCGGDDDAAAPRAATPTTTTTGAAAVSTTAGGDAADEDASSAAPETTGSLPAGAVAGLDDVDGDGEADATCGTSDLGGGLVVRTLCTPMAPENEDGVIAVAGGPLSLAGTGFPETDDVDATVRFGRDVEGRRVTIFQLGSDTLFDTGSATLRSTAFAALPGVAAAITAHLAGATVTVRGHADSRGSASDNQALSMKRAEAVAAWLTADGGLPADSVRAIGLGSTVPAALEANPDGSVSDVGRTLNRRVEIVAVTGA